MNIRIDYISGQSMYPYKIFRGNFIENTKDFSEVIDTIISVIGKKYFFDKEGFFIDCDNEELKERIITKLKEIQPEFEVSKEEFSCGSGFGYNVFIDKPINIIVKCSKCRGEAVTQDIGQSFPYTCGMCGEISMQYYGDIEQLQNQRNKLNREISTLKKATLKN